MTKPVPSLSYFLIRRQAGHPVRCKTRLVKDQRELFTQRPFVLEVFYPVFFVKLSNKEKENLNITTAVDVITVFFFFLLRLVKRQYSWRLRNCYLSCTSLCHNDTIIYVSLRTFHLLTFISKKFYDDEGVAAYADLTRWKHAVTYQHMDSRSLILTSFSCLRLREIDPGGDSYFRAVLFKRVPFTQTPVKTLESVH